MKDKRGNSHPIQDLIQEIRDIFLNKGFDEIENQIFIPEDEVYKQYGSEAPVVLDRCYYIAGLPRPDIGLSTKEIDKIMQINSEIDISELKNIFREYRDGSIPGDNIIEEMVSRLKISTKEAIEVINLFPAFRDIKAVSSKITLRSHMTAAWYLTLEAVQDKYKLPIKLFSIGLRFRREQRMDATHLRVHYGASCVIMDKNLTVDEGKRMSEEILHDLGFRNIKFIKKIVTSNYYESGTEYEIFSNGIEIADCGMYSEQSLRNYHLKYPVFNLGFGLERILMLRMNKSDVREVLYPQFYQSLEFTDEEIAKNIRIDKTPKSATGKKLANEIIKIAKENANADSPCKFFVWKGRIKGRLMRLFVLEKEKNTKLLGPAAMNEIYVYDGNIYGIPKNVKEFDNKLSKIIDNGVSTGITYLDAVANLFAYRIEKDGERFMQVKMAKTPSDVNIEIDNIVRRYITSKNKKISIKGPIFISILLEDVKDTK